MALTADQGGMIKHLETEDNAEPIAFEYEYDDHQQKTILGKGIFSSTLILKHKHD